MSGSKNPDSSSGSSEQDLPGNSRVPTPVPTPEGNPAPADERLAMADTTLRSADGSVGGGASPAWEPELPADFGRYRILRKLGSGGMGAVYLAHDSQLDRPVALKVPHFRRDEQHDTVERFYREARAMALLRHPNLCPVYDVGRHGDVHYFTMAHIEGFALSDVLKQPDRLRQMSAADVIRKLALALGEAHAAGIIHRDLKPSNVMIDLRGEPIVMDFGLARRDRQGEAQLTHAGVVLGTPAFMPPEQIRGDQNIGPAADVYSLGVILYQLLCGRLPFQGDFTALVAQILTSPVPRPSQQGADVDPGLEAICLKAMSRNPADRFASMGDLVSAIDELLAATPATQRLSLQARAAARPAIVPGCAHDLYISYAAVDDEPPPGAAGTAGWVTTLVEHLDWRLRQLLGHSEGASIWMAPRDEASQNDADAENPQARCALTLVVLSPGYVRTAGNDRLSAQLRDWTAQGSSMVMIERERLEEAALPATISRTKRVPFWEERLGQGVSILGHPRPRPEHDLAYYAKIDDLARLARDRMAETALRFEESAPAAAGPANAMLAEQATAGVVYLAEVTDDLDPLRDEAQRCLQQAGFRVIPDAWYPRGESEFRLAAAQDLTGALLFVQLLGSVAGKKPPGGAASYPRLQYEAAVAAGIGVLQWRDPRLDVASIRDSEHRRLVEGASVEAVELELFKRDAVRRAQAEVDRRRTHSSRSSGAEGAFVFIDAVKSDLPLTDALCQLLERRGCSYALPLHEGRAEEVREDLEANLLDCDGLIVVYGEITEQWVREQLRQWRKILFRRERPLRALAVYEAPPPEKKSLGMRLPKMHMIDCRTGLDELRLEAFFQELLRPESVR
jgi:Protein kinase domain